MQTIANFCYAQPMTSGQKKTSESLPQTSAEAEDKYLPSPADVIIQQDEAEPLLIDRELSLLEFNRRVLEEALDPENPILERVRFLSIVGSNLDEFFMVRVAGIFRQIEAGDVASAGESRPSAMLEHIRHSATSLLNQAQECFRRDLMPALAENGIRFLQWSDLSRDQMAEISSYFHANIFPVLTPLGVDPGHPFPHISNLCSNLAVLIREKDSEKFARVKVPDSLPQLLRIDAESYIWLHEVIRANLRELFPGMKFLEAAPFRVTRDADLEIQEWEALDLLETTQQTVRQRRFADVVRLEVGRDMSQHLLRTLMSNLEVDETDVYHMDGWVPVSELKWIANLDRPELKFRPFIPTLPAALTNTSEDIFAQIRKQDILIHHPFHSFSPVTDFLTQAARDPSVLTIKMTLYRVGPNSPIVHSLLEAMENGKQVAVFVELKARFDEGSNIKWAMALEREGVHVVYGLPGLKVHSKVALVVRKEGDAIRRYVHLSTGNYNPSTAALYTDLGLLTCDEQIGADCTDLFNFLTGYSNKTDYRQLMISPINLKSRLEWLIEREIEHQKAGRNGRIVIKVNSLVDRSMIDLLYKASQAGVKVDLIVRGVCCLRPGLPMVSENIRVISVIGRFLEHHRIFYFRNGGAEQVFLGSADLMPRNLDRRVEVVFPVKKEIAQQVINHVLKAYLEDTNRARIMKSDGTYSRLKTQSEDAGFDSQQFFMQNPLP
jgi:polyphosphate kinase